MYFKIFSFLVVLYLSTVLSKTIPRFADLDEEDHELYNEAYETPSYEYNHEEYEEDNSKDLIKDGLWALKAKFKELKALKKAFAASLLETKLRFKEMKKHHHHKKPSHEYYAPAPVYNAPQYTQPTYQQPTYQQHAHDPYYGH